MSSEDAVSTRAVADLADGDERHPLPEAAPSTPEAGFTHTLRVMAVAERAVFCLSLAHAPNIQANPLASAQSQATVPTTSDVT
jgi:hypothetical protein